MNNVKLKYKNLINLDIIDRVVITPIEGILRYTLVSLDDIEAIGIDSYEWARSTVAEIPKLYLKDIKCYT